MVQNPVAWDRFHLDSRSLTVSILRRSVMSKLLRWVCVPAVLAALSAAAIAATPGLDQNGKPDIKSATALAFGPKGVLFVGDPQGAQIFAIGVSTPSSAPINGNFK